MRCYSCPDSQYRTISVHYCAASILTKLSQYEICPTDYAVMQLCTLAPHQLAPPLTPPWRVLRLFGQNPCNTLMDADSTVLEVMTHSRPHNARNCMHCPVCVVSSLILIVGQLWYNVECPKLWKRYNILRFLRRTLPRKPLQSGWITGL